MQQYSATVWQRAIAEDRKVLAFAPQLEFASFVLGDYCIGLGRLGFFNFGSFRFGFQSQVLGFRFFRFRYLHATMMQQYPGV